MADGNEIPKVRENLPAADSGKKGQQLARENQVGDAKGVKSSAPVDSSILPAAELLLGKDGAKAAEKLLAEGRKLLEKAGIGVNPDTGYPEALSGAGQVRRMARVDGAQEFFGSQRAEEFGKAMAQGDPGRLSTILNRNTQETAHYQEATRLVSADLRVAEAKLGQA